MALSALAHSISAVSCVDSFVHVVAGASCLNKLPEHSIPPDSKLQASIILSLLIPPAYNPTAKPPVLRGLHSRALFCGFLVGFGLLPKKPATECKEAVRGRRAISLLTWENSECNTSIL